MLVQQQKMVLSPYSPIQMFKYLLLKSIFDLSDADVVERSKYDMSFKYFLDLAPEEDVINPSSLTKFRKLRLKDMDLLELLINKTVSIAVEKGIIKSKTIIVDAIHTKAGYNQKSQREILQEQSKKLRKAVYEVDETAKENEFEFNKDAGMYQCKAGHLAIRKAKNSRKSEGKNPRVTYYFDAEKCKKRPYKDGCYKEGAKSKSYAETIICDTHSEQALFQETEYFKEKPESDIKQKQKTVN